MIKEIARERLGFEQFRPGQLPAAQALVEGRDVLAVLPTGGGKSAIYELAGLLREGPTVVVSPLIALQDDQFAHLRAAGLFAVDEAHLISQWAGTFAPTTCCSVPRQMRLAPRRGWP